jgi:hypothetical protein
MVRVADALPLATAPDADATTVPEEFFKLKVTVPVATVGDPETVALREIVWLPVLNVTDPGPVNVVVVETGAGLIVNDPLLAEDAIQL